MTLIQLRLNEMLKTIRKNAHKKRSGIFARAVNIKIYNIENDVYADPFPRTKLEKAYQEYSFSKLIYDTTDDSYTIRFYSGYFIQFETLPLS